MAVKTKNLADGELICEANGRLVTLTINRPAKANALSTPILEAIQAVCEQIESDDALTGLVITGQGDRVFSGGADLKEMQRSESDPTYADRYYGLWASVTDTLETMPIPVIASINGACVAGGLSLALACDIRVASDNAFLSYPRIADGHLPGRFNLTRLIELVGEPRTKLVMLLGKQVFAEEACQWGLVDAIIDSNSADGTFTELLAPLSASSGALIRASKALVDHADRDDAWTLAAAAISQGDSDALNKLIALRETRRTLP
ncbi:MAG: enoyl-CoA hydratase/isomerase family protein [Pseudomonadota bacterium]